MMHWTTSMWIAFLIFATTTSAAWQCSPNQTYSEECSVCPVTCANRNGPFCLALTAGCCCNEGYIRKFASGDCILPEDCPKCPRNEEYTTCSACPLYCNENRTYTCKALRIGCCCKDGYIRTHEGGRCVKLDRCPKPSTTTEGKLTAIIRK